jgi:hypothetical protein
MQFWIFRFHFLFWSDLVEIKKYFLDHFAITRSAAEGLPISGSANGGRYRSCVQSQEALQRECQYLIENGGQ